MISRYSTGPVGVDDTAMKIDPLPDALGTPPKFVDDLRLTRSVPSESDYYRTAAASLSNSGTYQHRLGNHARAVKLYQEACGIREKALKVDELQKPQQQRKQLQRQHYSHGKDVFIEKSLEMPRQPQKLHHYGPEGDGMIEAKDRRALELEAWVRQVVAEEDRLRRQVAEQRRRKHAAVTSGTASACAAAAPPAPALDLFHTELSDRCPSSTLIEDPYDWSFGSVPLCISHPKLTEPNESRASHRQVKSFDALEQQDYVDSCKTLFNMGLVHLDRRADQQSHGIFRMALSVLTPKADPTLYAHLLNHLALTQVRMGKDADAVRTLNGALRFEQEHFNSCPSLAPQSPGTEWQAADVATCVSDTLSLLARTHRARGELGRAAEITAECLRVRTARLVGAGGRGLEPGNLSPPSSSSSPLSSGTNVIASVHPDVACARYNLGILLAESGKADEGMRYLDSFVDWVKVTLEKQCSNPIRQAQQDQERCQAQEQQEQEDERQGLPFVIDPTTADQLGTALHTVGLYHLDHCSSVTRAIVALKLSVSVRRSFLGPSDPDAALTLHTLGRVHSDLGSAGKAMACYRESIAVLRSTVGPDHSDVAAVFCDMGHLHHERGELDEAIATYGEALRIAKLDLVSVEGFRSYRVATASGVGGQLPQFEDLENAAAYEEEDDGSTEEAIAELLRIMGNVHLEMGSSSEAMSTFAEAERMLIRSASAASHAQRGAALQSMTSPPTATTDMAASLQASYPIMVPVTEPNGRGMNFHPCAAAA